MSISDLLYHKELNDAQWNRIKCLFEEPKKVGRPSLNPLKTEGVGAICLAVIGTVFITSSASGADSVCLNDYYTSSMATVGRHPCLRLIPLSAKFIRAHVRVEKTKVHVLINARMQLLNVVLTGGQIHDSETVVALLKGIKLKNFRIKHDFDSELYKQRNLVERFFQRIKNYRHISTRYDKLALCFENFVLLAASVIHF